MIKKLIYDLLTSCFNLELSNEYNFEDSQLTVRLGNGEIAKITIKEL